jgi:hypothetical protein
MSRRVVMVTLVASALLVVWGGATRLLAGPTNLRVTQAQNPAAQAKPSAKPAPKPATPAQEPAKPVKSAEKPAAAKGGVDGRYEGKIDTPVGPETGSLELRTEAGAIKGTLSTPSYPGLPVTGATLTGDQLVVTFLVEDREGTLRGTLKGEQIEGTWVVEDNSGAFSFKRVAAAVTPTAAPAVTPAPAAEGKAPGAPVAPADDPLSGTWDAVAETGGSTYPFTLSLTLAGDKVTGSVTSEMGTSPIEGTWSNGTLSFAFAMPDGAGIVMAATLADGKLTGSFTMGSEITGGWAASRRK